MGKVRLPYKKAAFGERGENLSADFIQEKEIYHTGLCKRGGWENFSVEFTQER